MAPPEPTTPLRVVVGTAGHIDHGKTALVRALTGIDTDRLPEEKARGITIELGFAHLAVSGAGGQTLAVIDVPGHERFVRTMVAGATGVDIALLVIAADEGVMPQTREHLDICGLLGIPRGVVALTKSDRVDAEWLALAADEARAALAGTFLERAAIVPCSALSGDGIPALARELERLASETVARPADGPLRLPIDRVFAVKGFGTVVTGTLASGSLREGDDVVALPGSTTSTSTSASRVARVRGLEVHGAKRGAAAAGERTAANLQGLERDELERGMVLVRPGEAAASSVIDVEVTILPVCAAPVKRRAKVLFHALTAQGSGLVIPYEAASLEPGARALAQIHLERPMALLPGDRFILRGFRALRGHGTTIGGGRVVRVSAPKRRRGDSAGLAMARRMAAATGRRAERTAERIALEIEAAGAAGIDRAALRARTGAGAKTIERAVEALLSKREALTVHRESGGIVSAAALAPVEEALLGALGRFHAQRPLVDGIAREELRTSLGLARALDPRVFAVALGELAKRGLVEGGGEGRVRRKGFSATHAEAERSDLSERVRALYRESGLAPPWTEELAARTGAAAAEARAALEIVIRRGDVVRVKPDLCFDRAALETLAARLRAHLDARGEITAQQWKELTGQSRKYSIPLAEHFDAEKLTLRVGEIRKLRRT